MGMADQADVLAQGVSALRQEDSAQQSLGVSLLESVIQNAPASSEAGTACYQLGCHYAKDRVKSLAYFKQSYGIPGKDQSNAGISVAHTLVATGKRLDAGTVFEEVGTRFPDRAKYAFYRGGMCYLGESRGKKDSAALRNRAKDLFVRSVAAGNLEAKLQFLGMRWEDCYDGKGEYDELIPDLETYANDVKAPKYARARCLLMIAEYGADNRDSDMALSYTSKVLTPEYQKCRTEQAWAMHVKAIALGDLGKWDEVVAVCNDIYSGFTDSNNFGGNNVRANALCDKARALKKLGQDEESAAVLATLRQEYPEYAKLGGLE